MKAIQKKLKMNIISKRDAALLKEKFGENCQDKFRLLENGTPLAYILGEWYFYGLTFRLNSDCLIPRPDTEHIVEKAIEMLPKGGVFADLCTGSGCIAISVLKNRPDLRAYAADISENALSAVKENAAALGIGTGRLSDGARLETVKTDLLKAELSEFLPKVDGILCNPPYIKTDVLKTLETIKNEPVTALDGGEDGLTFYHRLIPRSAGILKPDGVLIYEIGYDQAADVSRIASENSLSCRIFRDYGGNDRVALMKKENA